MKLSGQQRRKLLSALISAFPNRSSLEQLLDFELDKKLNKITQDNNLQTIVYQLIETAQAQGWLLELVRAARKENPENSELTAIALELSNIQKAKNLLTRTIGVVLVVLITTGTMPLWVPILVSQINFVPSQKTPAPSPIEFIETYYDAVDKNQFDRAWEMLTPQFQKQVPKSGYLEFKQWWSSVDKVDVQSVSLVSQTDNMAIVTIQIAYVIRNRYIKEKLQQFTLIWNSSIKNWQIHERVFLTN
ncbi:hypothetical protein NUACC21_63410 [Scytonema sp. NUACC21]